MGNLRSSSSNAAGSNRMCAGIESAVPNMGRNVRSPANGMGLVVMTHLQDLRYVLVKRMKDVISSHPCQGQSEDERIGSTCKDKFIRVCLDHLKLKNIAKAQIGVNRTIN